MDIRNVVIVGKGALGLLFGTLIATGRPSDSPAPGSDSPAPGSDSPSVSYLADDERYARYAARPAPTVNGAPCRIPNLSVSEARTRPAADLVIVCVKARGLDAALDSLEAVVGSSTRIISLMNGITSEERIAARFGWSGVVLAIAQGMDATYTKGALTYTHTGEIRLGPADGTDPEAVSDIQRFLASRGVSAIIEDDIRHRLWVKFMLNVGVNQTCMVFGGTYGSVSELSGEEHRTFVAAMREAQAVARAEGVELTEDDIDSMVRIIASLDPAGMPSMAQDRLNKCPSEVGEFSGAIITRAERHGIHVPTNRWLYARVREIESAY